MPPSSRRRFLRTIAAGSLVGAAGCQSTDPATRSPTTDGRTPTPTDGTGTDPGDEETPTPEPAVDPLDGSWESYRHGAANTAAITDPGPGRAGEPGELWRRATATDAVPATAPAAAGDAFVVVMRSGDPYALEAADGGIRWVADRQASADVDPVATTPGLGDGTVVVGLAAGEALAVDAGSGDERWRAPVGGEPVVRPSVAGGRAFVADERGLVALDATDGERLWRVEPGDRTAGYEVAAAPVATADAVYLVAVTPDAPVPRDEGSTSGSGTPTPPPTDTEGFAARVVALAPADGRTQWRSHVRGTYNFTSGPPAASLAVAGSYGGDGRGDGGDATGEASRVIVGVGGRLHAVEADDGAAAWSVRSRSEGGGHGGPVTGHGGPVTGRVGDAAGDRPRLPRPTH